MTAPDPAEQVVLIESPDRSPRTYETGPTWRILIVDDDDDVHQVTRFALHDTLILGRRLEFLEARSAAEAERILQNETDIACILLDVVMETESAGLDLVGFVRDKLANHRIQIVLRTGQPGYAPELSVIRDLDINDYRSKSELTHTRLITTLTAAIRAYHQLNTIELNRQGLEKMVEGASQLARQRKSGPFCDSVLAQLARLLRVDCNGLLCRANSNAASGWEVLASSGALACRKEPSGEAAIDTELVDRLSQASDRDKIHFEDGLCTVPLRSPSGDQLVMAVQIDCRPDPVTLKLLKLFSVNVAVGYDNARMFERLEELAYIDELTRVPNRTGMMNLIEDLIAQQQPFLLVLIDIDHFQTVNDGLGREAGDRILKTFTDCLQAGFGDQARVGRLGGDAFVVVLARTDLGVAEQRFEAFCKQMAGGIRSDIEDYEIPLTVTGGVAEFPAHGQGADELLHNAGIALKHGKRRARSLLCCFTRDFEQELKQRLQVARELRTGIGAGQLLVRYQPRIALGSYRVIGVEALARWQRPGRIVGPRDFMDAAEESGLIVEIGRHVLTETCRQQRIWADRHGLDLAVSVNVSMRQMRDIDFLGVVDEVLGKTGIDPARLEFEITESVMMEDTGKVQHLLSELRRRGTKIAVDDFGTGYSSLSYLQRLPLDRVKIDQSFVTGVDRFNEDRVIVAMIINMSHLLDLQVVAEGVENVDQESRLLKLGCDECQGHYYSRALPAEKLPDFCQQFG
jgi:diguanylate cyclase (GGDEF)-like protein